MRLVNLEGKIFGRLMVIKRAEKNLNNKVYWGCVCECGEYVDVIAQQLTSGKTQSCGCLNQEVITRHGNSYHPLYQTYMGMLKRCHHNDSRHYKNYGGKGVHVCARWRESFDDFLYDMGPKPSADCTIDRINNDRGYEPDNCRWADKTTQSRNRGFTKNIAYRGRDYSANEFAEFSGLHYVTVLRMLKEGASAEDMLARKEKSRR